jgi:hypothetical protein
LLVQDDTRTLAGQWVQQNIPINSKIGQDHYTGELPSNRYRIIKQYSLSQGKSFDEYKKLNFSYLIVSSTMYDRFFAEPDKYSQNISFYNDLFREGKLIKEFKPDPKLWPHPHERFAKYHIHVSPTIRIFKLD